MNATNADGRRVWWSRAVMIAGIAAVALPLFGALGTHVGAWSFKLGLLLFAVGFLVGFIGLVGGIIAAIVVLRRKRTSDRRPVFVGTALSALIVVFLGAQFAGARGVPPMHDVTTDMADPPSFDVVVKLRGEGADINTLAYDPEKLPPQQRAAYPKLVPLDVSATPTAAFDTTVAVLRDLGLEVVNADRESMRIEAVATTFWFGFKDDVVVRIRPTDTGARIDVRSVSRVGVGDSGVNAGRHI